MSLSTTPGLLLSMNSLRVDILDDRNSSFPMRTSWDTARMAYSLHSFTGYSAEALDLSWPDDGFVSGVAAVAGQRQSWQAQ